GFFEEWRNIANLAERYPGVPIVHTIPTWNFPREGIGRTPREGKIRIRQDIRDLLGLPNVYFEITPIAYGAAFEYPYTEAIQSFLPYYEEWAGRSSCGARTCRTSNDVASTSRASITCGGTGTSSRDQI